MSEPVIVFDNGSGYLKAGLSNVEIPSVTMPALIGRPMLRYAEKLENIEKILTGEISKKIIFKTLKKNKQRTRF